MSRTTEETRLAERLTRLAELAEVVPHRDPPIHYRTRAMVGVVIVLVVVVVAVAIVTLANPNQGSRGRAPAGARSACSAPAIRIQFWPKGTPADPRAHLAIYPNAHGPSRQQDRIGYADQTVIKHAFVCGLTSEFSRQTQQMRRKVRTSSAVKLVCRPDQVRAFSIPGSVPTRTTQSFGQVQLRDAFRRIFYAIFNANQLTNGGGPVLQYDARVCAPEHLGR